MQDGQKPDEKDLTIKKDGMTPEGGSGDGTKPAEVTVTLRVGQILNIQGLLWRIVNMQPEAGFISLKVMTPEELAILDAQIKAQKNGKVGPDGKSLPTTKELLKMGDEAIKNAGGPAPKVEVGPQTCPACRGKGRSGWAQGFSVCVTCKGTGEVQNNEEVSGV